MQADKPRAHVLVCGAIDPAGLALLREYADVEHRPEIDAPTLLTLIADYEGLIVDRTVDVDAAVVERGLRLKVIGVASATLDHVDIAAVQQRDLSLVNSPDDQTIAVAEHTMGLLLAAARRLPRANRSLEEGRWEPADLVGTSLAGKSLGIIGYGRIGRQVALRAQAFGMKILVNQIRPTPELKLDVDIRTVDLDDLLAAADFVSLHVPFGPETEALIGAEQLARMKSGAYLINTSRGGVIDRAALLAALDEGKLAGAALDLYEQPPAHDPLVEHPATIVTPRIAGRTDDADRATAISVAEQVVAVLRDIEIESILPLRVVALDKVIPHESIDPRRVSRLADRLQQESKLVNPPIVIAIDDRYMVLDGATRTAALKQLGFPHAIVQVSSPEQGLGLHTWYHIVSQIAPEELLTLLRELPGISLVPTPPERADDDLFEYGALCYFHLVGGDVFLVHAAQGTNRLDALNTVTELYIRHAVVERTLEKRLTTLQVEYPEMAALVVFPEYTVSQVMQVTLSGRYFPAGITRFIIPGRILRLNADLAFLRADRPLREKNRQLREMLLEKLNQNQIRYYAEPVYLLDE